ncbi:DUF1934 family protein [bacterium LRH843]|nr:DUF1934 family protein [bacterium LRH843]
MEKAMKRVLKMHFRTKIEQGTHQESYEFTTTGELFHKGNQEYLTFKETLSETDTVQTTMKWNGSELMLIRQGVIVMRQAFTVGKETYGRYVTPEASWETTAKTDHILVDWPKVDKMQGRIELSYQFRLQGQDAGKHRVTIILEEDK